MDEDSCFPRGDTESQGCEGTAAAPVQICPALPGLSVCVLATSSPQEGCPRKALQVPRALCLTDPPASLVGCRRCSQATVHLQEWPYKRDWSGLANAAFSW